jgi:hypothetical protein
VQDVDQTRNVEWIDLSPLTTDLFTLAYGATSAS